MSNDKTNKWLVPFKEVRDGKATVGDNDSILFLGKHMDDIIRDWIEDSTRKAGRVLLTPVAQSGDSKYGELAAKLKMYCSAAWWKGSNI